MAIQFDARKSAKNGVERGFGFELAEQLEWDKALIIEDTRKDYGEIRLRVLAYNGDRLYAAVSTPRGGDLRVISLRKANKQEVRVHGKKD